MFEQPVIIKREIFNVAFQKKTEIFLHSLMTVQTKYYLIPILSLFKF